jgi:hypothetical protein
MPKHKYIESPEKMWELFCEYVKHESEHPMSKVDYVGKDGKEVETKLETPITFDGFECYLADKGVINDLGHYTQNLDNRYAEYVPIVTRIQKNCFVHNFKGAAVGLFNPNLIARKLGLTEKTENTNRNIEIPLFPDVQENDSDKQTLKAKRKD